MNHKKRQIPDEIIMKKFFASNIGCNIRFASNICKVGFFNQTPFSERKPVISLQFSRFTEYYLSTSMFPLTIKKCKIFCKIFILS